MIAKKVVLAIVALFALGSAAHAQIQAYKRTKMGFEYMYIMNSLFNVKETTADDSAQKSGALDGPAFFYEYLYEGQFGIDGQVGYLQRELKNMVISSKSSTIDEVAIVAMARARTYFQRNRGRGFRYWGGAGFGVLATSSKVKIGPTAISGKTATANAQVVSLSVGADYLFKNAGLRGVLSYMNSNFTDNASFEGYEVFYEFDTLVINLGFYAFY